MFYGNVFAHTALPVLGSRSGAAPALLPDFLSELMTNALADRGAGAVTYAARVGGSITDWEGLIRPALDNESVHDGVRRVENLITDDTATLATSAATTAVSVGVGVFVFSMGVGTGTATFSGTATGSSGTLDAGATKRVAETLTITVAGTIIVTASVATLIDIQLEDVTGQANQNPASYVSRGVLSTPYHGVHVDGVKCYNTENGNTVAANVVTEAAGDPIADAVIKGVSIWEGRTNEVASSEEFDREWTQTSSAIEDYAILGPDGAARAAKLSDNGSSNNRHYVRQYLGSENGEDWTESVYAKAGTTDWITIGLNVGGGGGHGAYFDLGNGVLGTVAGPATAEIEDKGNGWYRCSVTEVWGSGSDRCDIALADSDGGVIYDASSTSYYAYIWGAQLEEGSFMTPYIPSLGSIPTPRGDSLYDGDAANYSDEMTLVGEFYTSDAATGQSRVICKFSDEGANTYVQVLLNDAGLLAAQRLNAGSDFQTEIVASALAAGHHKFACTFSLTGTLCHVYVDGARATGGATQTDTTAMTGMDRFLIGRIENETLFLNGNMKNLKVYNSVLTDAQLTTMST
jgi:hypothetical protein